MRLAGITVSVLTVGALALFGCSTGSDKEQPVSSISNVQGGETDTTHKFAVGVCDGNAPGRCQGICSGALILPNLVATARHCVSKSPELINCEDNPTFGADKTVLYVTTNSSMFGGSGSSAGWYKSKKIFRPADNHVCGNDIALIQLENSVPETEAKPITPNIQHQMWDSKYFVPSFTAVGYGRTAPANGQFAGEGTRRILGQIDIRCIPGSPTIDCPAMINEGEFVGGDGICQGDSGSSAYDQASFDQEAPVSFGVLSRGGASADGTLCQGSLYSRFDAHRDFVIAAAKEASANWTKYAEPEWTGTPDAAPGGSKPAAPTKKAKVGETCKKSKDCDSGKCVQDADGTRTCATNCSEDESVCGEGQVCSDGACMAAPEDTSSSSSETGNEDISTDTNGTLPASEAPKTVTTTTSACSFSSGASSSSNAWLIGLGLAVLAVRRRRSA